MTVDANMQRLADVLIAVVVRELENEKAPESATTPRPKTLLNQGGSCDNYSEVKTHTAS